MDDALLSFLVGYGGASLIRDIFREVMTWIRKKIGDG